MRRIEKDLWSVWGALMLVTGLSWAIGTDHGLDDPRVASVLVLVLAFAKVYLVGSRFMEIYTAPPALRLLLGGWCVGVGGGLIGVYLAGG